MKVMDVYQYANAYSSSFTINALEISSDAITDPQTLYDAVARVVELNFGIEKTHFITARQPDGLATGKPLRRCNHQ